MPQIKIVNNYIVFHTSTPVRTKELFPDAKSKPHEGRYICAIPHDIDHVRILKNLRPTLDVPSPIESSYKWTGRFTPYAHQIKTAGFLTSHARAFCLNGMGTMKTSSSLWACDYLMRQGHINRCLIVAPLSCLERVWGDEIFGTLPRRKFAVLHGSRERRLAMLNQDVDFYIINHDGLSIILEELGKRPDINHIIIDEIGSLRSHTTRKYKAANAILNKQHPRSCWGLTGTPTPNAPYDAYAQIKLIKPENYRQSFQSFKFETMQQVTTFKWVPKRGAEEFVHKHMQPSIRYALEDCTDLPPTIYQTRMCDLSHEQKKHFDDMIKYQILTIGESEVTAANAAVLIGKLMQLVCGCIYSTEGARIPIDFKERYSLLEECIEECNEKVIVFVPLTGALDLIYEKLVKRWTVEIVDGSVTSAKRNDIFHRFQKTSDPHILLANAGTMAHGLTLTAASTIIWYAPTNSADTYNQANARIVRPGQTQITNIVHLCATTVEEKIYAALKEKTRLQDVILNLVKGGGR